tara:strand:+ start:24610 stop:25113 length:504 start_codon:yes stop_codon:yes gene_type:complete
MAKKTIDEIVEEKYPTFANMMKDIRLVEELDKTLVIYLRQKESLVIQKARDEELIRLKDLKAELSKPYNQTISALKKMINCIYKFGHKFENDLKEKFESNLVEYQTQLSYIKMRKDADRELELVGEAIADINGDFDPTIKKLEQQCEYITWLKKERFELDEPKEIEI